MFGKRIVELRKRQGLTQTELAKSMGISRSALSLYEIEKREPDIETLNKLASLFNVPVGYIIGNKREVIDYENYTMDAPEFPNEVIMNKLKLLREQAGMTQTELGKLLHVKDAAISKYESGKVPLTGETLLQLSKIFNVSIDYLLGNERKVIDYENYTMDAPEFPNEVIMNKLNLLREQADMTQENLIGKRIKLLRKSCGLTQTELGNKLGVIKQTVSSWENGISTPNTDTLTSMSRIFDVTVDYLLGNDKSTIERQKDELTNIQSELSEREQRLLDTFRQLNEDNQDIIIGEMKKYLKEQRLEAAASGKYQKEA